jgi:hypothetical protein
MVVIVCEGVLLNGIKQVKQCKPQKRREGLVAERNIVYGNIAMVLGVQVPPRHHLK